MSESDKSGFIILGVVVALLIFMFGALTNEYRYSSEVDDYFFNTGHYKYAVDEKNGVRTIVCDEPIPESVQRFMDQVQVTPTSKCKEEQE